MINRSRKAEANQFNQECENKSLPKLPPQYNKQGGS